LRYLVPLFRANPVKGEPSFLLMFKEGFFSTITRRSGHRHDSGSQTSVPLLTLLQLEREKVFLVFRLSRLELSPPPTPPRSHNFFSQIAPFSKVPSSLFHDRKGRFCSPLSYLVILSGTIFRPGCETAGSLLKVLIIYMVEVFSPQSLPDPFFLLPFLRLKVVEELPGRLTFDELTAGDIFRLLEEFQPLPSSLYLSPIPQVFSAVFSEVFLPLPP